MADIREAEGIESQTTGTAVRKSHAGAQLGMPWTSEAEEAISSLAQGKHRIVQLVMIAYLLAFLLRLRLTAIAAGH